MVRKPAVAGMFYEEYEDELIRSIEGCFLNRLGPGTLPKVRKSRLGHVLGLICPHAGYLYSGPAAAYSYMALAKDGLPDVAVVLGPNHHGLGPAAAVSSKTEWVTPLGTMHVDIDTVEEIARLSTFARTDNLPHIREHSIEVQLPFLQYLSGKHKGISIVPIAIAHLNKTDALMLMKDLGSAIAQSLEGKSGAIIASTDFTHYESQERACARDALAMAHILNLDPEGLIETIYEKSITMCGVVGTAVMLQACKTMGAEKARKLTYYTSGDVTGDTDQVVGYGALSILA